MQILGGDLSDENEEANHLIPVWAGQKEL